MRRLPGPAILALALALAVAGGAAGGARTPPSLSTLLARHVPVLVLHPAEAFEPVPVDGFLADSDLTQKTAAGWVPVSGPLPSGGAGLRLDQRYCDAIEGPAASPCYAAAEAEHAASPVVYGAAFRTATQIDLQYWLWYPYDDYSATNPPGEVWQVHEGDWESVSVILDSDGHPLVVALSAHCKGTRRAWTRVQKRGVRPLVYVALGSHANYFGAGIHPLNRVCWPPETRDIVRAFALADRTGAGRVVRPRPVRVTATSPSWMTYAGAWGEAGYLHFPNNPPVVYGAGPRGPAFHAQWRRPVAEAMSWPRG
jgi:Vacuolar protein sorting-associated protein 62